MFTRTVSTFLFLFLFTASSSATVIHVDDDAPNDPGPGDPTVSDPNENGSPDHPYDEIAVGIWAAQPGDTVLVHAGTYAGQGNKNLNFLGKGILLISEAGPATCIIDCESDGQGFYFHTGETSETIVDGFTIKNGSSATLSGGLHFAATTDNPIVRNCHIADCTHASGPGGCVHIDGCAPTLINCTVSGGSNSSTEGVWAANAEVTFDRCRIVDNHGVGLVASNSQLTMTNCIIAGNIDRGLIFGGGTNTLVNCTITHNSTTATSGAGLYHFSAADTHIHNCVLWGNIDAGGDPSNETVQLAGATAVTHSCIQGLSSWAGYHNAGDDPRFADPAGLDGDPFGATDNDYRPAFDSVCTDAGDNNVLMGGVAFDIAGKPRFVDVPTVADAGTGTPPLVDVGAYEFQMPTGDLDEDTDVDMDDAETLFGYLQGPGMPLGFEAWPADFQPDGDVDLADFAAFQGCFTGPFADCNDNGVPDDQDVATGTSEDCNTNGVPDECDVADGTSDDCNSNLIPDECEFTGFTEGCHFPVTLVENTTGHSDSFFLDAPDDDYADLGEAYVIYLFDCGTIVDEDGPDLSLYEVDWGAVEFDRVDVLVSSNGMTFVSIKSTESALVHIPGDEAHDDSTYARSYDLAPSGLAAVNYVKLQGQNGGGFDVDAIGAIHAVGTPFDRDCNGNEVLDECDIADGTSQDCNVNGIPDECDIADGTSQDTNGNGIPDECEIVDCNTNGVPDDVDIATGTSNDCNNNTIPDECDIADGTSEDCQPNGIPDECDLAASSLHPDIVHRWSFTTDASDSVGTAHGTLMSGASVSGGAVELDGTDDYVELPIATTIGGLSNITLEAWVEWNGGGDWQRIFDIGTDTANYMFLTPATGGAARFAIRTPSINEQQLTGTILPTATPTHVAVTIDAATQTATLYIDGSFAVENPSTTLTPADLGTTAVGYLGKSFWPDPHFNGRISEFRIYSTALSATEIADNYAGGPDVTGGPVSNDCNTNGVPDECDIAAGTSQDLNTNGIPDECEILDCNTNGVPDDVDIANGTSSDCNSNAIPDECDIADGTSRDCQPNGIPDECDIATGTSQDLNFNGTPDECELGDCNSNGVPDAEDIAIGTSQDCNVNGIPDECDIADGASDDCNTDGVPDECVFGPPVGYGLLFDGVAQSVDLGTPPQLRDLPVGEFTLEMWIRTTDHSRSVLIGNYDGNPSWNLELHDTAPAGHLRLYLNGEDHHDDLDVADGRWHHIAAVRELDPQGHVRLYVDAMEVYHNVSNAGSYTVARSTMLACDPRPGSHFLGGMLDEVRVWNVVRTPEQILDGMFSTMTGTETGLVGYWKLDDATGGTAVDTTGNSNGALVNDPIWTIVDSDCNGNGTLDECDILDGTSLDLNGNQVPDECEGRQ